MSAAVANRQNRVAVSPARLARTAERALAALGRAAGDVRRQARRVDVALATELDLLVTHGVLHLVGYDDRDPIEARLMHEREREILWAGRRRLPARLWRGLLETPQLSHDRRRPDRRRAGVEPAAVNQSRIPHRGRSGVRSTAAPVSGHPRSKPASRTPLQ